MLWQVPLAPHMRLTANTNPLLPQQVQSLLIAVLLLAASDGSIS